MAKITSRDKGGVPKRQSKESLGMKGNEVAIRTGSIVFTLRRQKRVGVLQPNRELQTLCDRDLICSSTFTNRRTFEPYGLVYDPNERTLWVADKGNSCLIRLALDSAGRVDTVERVVPGEKEQITIGLIAPCSLDICSRRGILVSCFGNSEHLGSLVQYREGNWTRLVPPSFLDRISHATWLEKDAFCYITRSDSVLWLVEKAGATPTQLTTPSVIPQAASVEIPGALELMYVQGLVYSPLRKKLYLADALRNAVYSIDASILSKCSKEKSHLGQSNAIDLLGFSSDRSSWRGPARAIALGANEDEVISLDGGAAEFHRIRENRSPHGFCKVLMDDEPAEIHGCGIRFID